MALTLIHKSEGAPKGNNGPKQNYSKMHGTTPMPAGRPKGGKALAANPNLKGGSK